MKSTSFILDTASGPMEISCNTFWWQYQHCLLVHPESEPIKDALEHCLQIEILNELPQDVVKGCTEIISFYSARAVPGKVRDARLHMRAKYTPEQQRELHTAMVKKCDQLNAFLMAQPVGPVQ